MRRRAGMALWVALAGCTADRAPAVGASAAPDRIEWGAMGAWGSSWRKVAVTGDGAVTLAFPVALAPDPPCTKPPAVETAPCPGPARTATRTIGYAIGPGGDAELRAILAPLERLAARHRRCTDGLTDAGSAWMTWSTAGRGRSYRLGEACSPAENASADRLVKAAEARLSELGSNAPQSIEDAQ